MSQRRTLACVIGFFLLYRSSPKRLESFQPFFFIPDEKGKAAVFA
jgi:hypothetical protein